jgi:hypothetical protein
MGDPRNPDSTDPTPLDSAPLDSRLDDRHHDDDDEHDDADADDDPHLHVLPPHLLADAVRAAAEALGRDGEGVYGREEGGRGRLRSEAKREEEKLRRC